MSLFGKKIEPPPAFQPPPFQPPPKQPGYASGEPPAPKRSYGVADLIMLMKTIPIDHHPDLVVQVVKSTLASVGVQASDIIEDALHHENTVKDRIASIESEIDGMNQEIERRRDLIAQLLLDVADLTYARERWQSAETSGFVSAPVEESPPPAKPHTLPPPLPPPFHKPSTAKPPELS